MSTMRTRLVSRLSYLGLVLATAQVALAFPPAPPNDPIYPPAAGCPPPLLPDPACAPPSGQWNLFSFWPNNPPDPGHASGISADLAWDVTTGRSDVVVVVLDSGVNYDHEDLRNKIWLSCGELPAPQDALGMTTPGSSPGCREPSSTYDVDGDDAFTIRDYTNDPRITNTINPSFLSRADLRVFENGVDEDGNGFTDDISGWDARDGDGDEFRTNGDGHGTGRNGFIGAEADNGTGIAGICPKCPLANVRVDGTFVTRTESAGIGAIWAADQGHEVINMALGATSASSFTRAAFDYFTRKNGLALNATANEFSFHQNFHTVFDDVMGIGGVVFDNPLLVTTYLRKANFSNYGAHIEVVTPTDAQTTGGGTTSYGTSSGTSSSVPHAAGVAGLVFSRARELIDSTVLDTSALALKDISAQEVRQILNRTADDIVMADDPTGPYGYLPGWDRWTGYGRINARSAVDRVAPGTIPPEADINRPDWYSAVDGTVSVEFYANARWATSFDWILEVGAGIEAPSFTTIASGTGEAATPALSSANLVSNFSRPWTTPGTDGFYTLRLTVTDDLGNVGEDRMGVWVRSPDPQAHAGWPQTLPASIDSVAGGALVDLDGDNTLEIILSTGDGEVHAFRHDGSELAGFPVSTDQVGSLPTCCSDAFDGSTANGEVPLVGASLTGGVTVADIDRDGVQEICAGSYNGRIYCWNADGTPQPGFPVETDLGITVDQYTGAHKLNARGEAVLVPPAVEDLDGDGDLELVAGAFDQKLYVWRSDGTRMAPWPKEIFDASQVAGVNVTHPKEIISVPVIADIDLDGVKEIVFGTNETYSTPAPAPLPGLPGGSGRVYAYEPDGTLETGWPVAPTSIAPSAVPLVADGVGTSPMAADIDGNGDLEIAIGLLASDTILYNHDGSTFATMSGTMGGTGPGSDADEATPEGGLGLASDQPVRHYVGLGAFADVEGDGLTDYMVGTLGIGILPFALASGAPTPFDHYLSVWDATTGVHKATFPRVMEDWQFFTGATVADIDGAVGGLPEMVASSGGYFVHAFNALGLEPTGWPKNVGHWVVMSPSIGDLDDDGDLEVVVATRMGDIHVWDMAGGTCANVQWRKAKHDEWNTGVRGKDTLRPARIEDLTASVVGPNVMLDWTAVGDDGKCGTATTYELRAATFPITLSNFASATPVAIPPPQAAGAAESATFTPPLGAVYFALRAVDEASNIGVLTTASTLLTPTPTATTTATPTSPPATPTPIATATPGCPSVPLVGCRVPIEAQRALLLLKNKTPNDRDQLNWKWRKGMATAKSLFGNPTTTTAYQLCLYDGSGLISTAIAPAGGSCAGRPCWKETTRGFLYKDKERTPNGLLKITLREGLTAGKAKIGVRGKGGNLPMPALPIAQPVRVQLSNTIGACWEATYSAPAIRNQSDQFKDKSD